MNLETGIREIDRWDGGVGWITHPDEDEQRASHALVVDGDVWLLDPVDADGLDAWLDALGTVVGVVICLDRHKRDAGAIARRYDVPVYIPTWMDGVAEAIDAPIARFDDGLPDTPYRAIPVVRNRFWQEVALYDESGGTLYVPEAVGTIPFFATKDEPLGVQMTLRLFPPRNQLGGLPHVERVLVGHGGGVFEDADGALANALAGSRRGFPRLLWETLGLLFGR